MTVCNDFVFSRVTKPPHPFRIRGMSARCEFRRLSDGDPVPCWIMTFDCTPEAPDSDLPYRGQIEHCAPIERQHLVFPTTTTIIEDHNNFYMKMMCDGRIAAGAFMVGDEHVETSAAMRSSLTMTVTLRLFTAVCRRRYHAESTSRTCASLIRSGRSLTLASPSGSEQMAGQEAARWGLQPRSLGSCKEKTTGSLAVVL